jgi:hypothetical protein
MFWYIPATTLTQHSSDKLALSLLFILIVCYRLPFSLLTIGSSVCGLVIWDAIA